MKRRYNRVQWIGILLAGAAIYSCNVTRYVPENDKLYLGARIVAPDSVDNSLKNELAAAIKPKPNKRFFGIPIQLGIYSMIKPPKKNKGLKYRIKNKVGKPPVLLSQVDTAAANNKISGELFEKGFFRPQVSCSTHVQDKTATLDFIVTPGPRYTIRNIYFPPDTNLVYHFIDSSREKTLLKKGDYIDLKTLRAERERIDLFVKEHGFYYFEPENLIIRADSLHNASADVYIALKKEFPPEAIKQWTLGDILVFSNYKFEKDSVIQQRQRKEYKYFYQIDRRRKFKPYVFDRAILLRKDSIYRRYRHSLTIERLMNLGTFRFVRIDFDRRSDSLKNRLDTKIYLTPSVKQNVRLEVSGNTESTHYVGTDLTLIYRNTNVFHGAEILDLKATGGWDWLPGNTLFNKAQTYYLEASLAFPRLIPNYKVKLHRNPYLPRTVLKGGFGEIRFPNFFSISIYALSAGYKFKQGKNLEVELTPVNTAYFAPKSLSKLFTDVLNSDQTLKASFGPQLLLGGSYSVFYNNTYLADRRWNYALRGSIDMTGTVPGLLIKSDGSPVGGKKLFGIPISQFVKPEVDLRTYLNFNPKWTLVNRLNSGLAIGYGNSPTLPFSEQFFIGGGSSLRAFRVRTLGPGSYHTPQSNYEANESGEIKIEWNEELRYDMNKYFKPALFMDAGNIWLREAPPDKPGSGFGKDFLKEIAVGIGVGLRVDITFLVLRADLAMPIRKPWYPEGKRWVFNEIDFGSAAWRRENLVLNIGVGYPF